MKHLLSLIYFLVFSSACFGAEFDHIKFSPDQPNKIGYIVIDDKTSGISQATWIYVKNALDEYKLSKPIFIILELNTPGGEVYAAQKISDALKEMDTQYDIPIVAYINNWAISAGAMLAYSSRYITTVKDGSMGAAEPILEGETGKIETASEKINSAIRADFANRAAFFDRNPVLAEAMVDKDLIVVKRGEQIIKLDSDSQILPTDRLISPKGKLLTLTSKEMLDYGVANLIVAPGKISSLTYEEQKTGVWPFKKSGLSQAPFFSTIPHAEVVAYRMDWRAQFFSLLAHPLVQSILFLGLMMGFYIELSSPGFGFAGTIGMLSLVLIVLSSYSQEIGGLLEVAFVGIGILLLVIDLFLLPTFGLFGLIGLLFFIGGLFALMLPHFSEVSFDYDSQSLNAAGVAFFQKLTWLAGTFLVGLGLMAVLAKWIAPRFKGLDKFVLHGSEQVGYKSTDDPNTLPQMGSSGVVYSTLRPSGKVLIEYAIYEAVSRGSYISKDDRIKVVGYEGSSLIVDRCEET